MTNEQQSTELQTARAARDRYKADLEAARAEIEKLKVLVEARERANIELRTTAARALQEGFDDALKQLKARGEFINTTLNPIEREAVAAEARAKALEEAAQAAAPEATGIVAARAIRTLAKPPETKREWHPGAWHHEPSAPAEPAPQLGTKPMPLPYDDRHWLIYCEWTDEPIGCTDEDGKADVLTEEPDARFVEQDPKTCPICKELK